MFCESYAENEKSTGHPNHVHSFQDMTQHVVNLKISLWSSHREIFSYLDEKSQLAFTITTLYHQIIKHHVLINSLFLA